MNGAAYSYGVRVGLRPHHWACLVLAALLLYNPFLAAYGSADGLRVCHPASHRATVGASELQHFSPADGRDCLPVIDIAKVEIVVPLPKLTAQSFVISPPLPPLSHFYGPGLWFRPPPAH